ncbi:carboxypeptidase B [Microplitis demolitor]|uniref:carboxypeptidase B n=1 Tax=Microplitis demolitor TaxID=69319 RepID=UPI0006D5146F|nr:carboxypeptidase B [Microplitis demolitor]
MNMFYFILIIFIIAAGSNGEYHPPLKGMQYFSITCKTPEQLSLLRSLTNNPNVLTLKLSQILGESADILVTADESSQFKNILLLYKIDHTIITDDVEHVVHEEALKNNIVRMQSSRITLNKLSAEPFDYYPRYHEMEEYITFLAKNYSEIVSVDSIGTSFQNRTLYVIKISSGGDNKPQILIDAGIHAREWIAPSTALYAVHQLVTNQSNTYLYKNVDWLIIPSLNPDGYEYTHSNYRFWRKTRSINKGSTCIGTDANRNFDLKWMTVGASSNPCSETYGGPKPFSEVETLALKDYVMANNKTIKAYLTLHSYGQYLLHPWGYTSDLPENEPELRSVAERAAAALAAPFGTRYTIGSSTNVLYAAAGGSDDWLMGVAGANLSYTVELPGGRFDPPPSRIEFVGIETFEAFKVFQEYIEKTFVN